MSFFINKAKSILLDINKESSSVNIRFTANVTHIQQRQRERNIHDIDVLRAIKQISKHLGKITWYTYLEPKQYSLFLKNNDLILVMGLTDSENGYTWKIRTVLDPNQHNKHNDEKVYGETFLI